MMDERSDDVLDFIDEVVEGRNDLRSFEATWGALASFLTDYEHLKGLNELTQGEVARRAGTVQSAISRLERMRGKPTYALLRRLSEAVNGELYLTPMADVTVTLPYDLQDKARELAENRSTTVKDLMQQVLRDAIERPKYTTMTQASFAVPNSVWVGLEPIKVAPPVPCGSLKLAS
jgi:transcriptional regulator with XRE-family HTH domain